MEDAELELLKHPEKLLGGILICEKSNPEKGNSYFLFKNFLLYFNISHR
jgi:hypothetical protein